MQGENLQIMGILNVTPDSFSDGGESINPKNAEKKALKLQNDGADIIDIGGEASGPGSVDVSLEEELRRVMPLLRTIRRRVHSKISVDTCKAEVARQALEAGADMINDISALRFDPEMAETIAAYHSKVCIMYSKDPSPRTSIKKTHYTDIISTIGDFFEERIQSAQKAGIAQEDIILDPGMGHFVSAIPRYSYEIIARLPELCTRFRGHQILIGISRKSLLGDPLQGRDERAKPLTALAYLNGARIIRTHDVRGIREFFNDTDICPPCA